MEISDFIEKNNLVKKSEIEKVLCFMYFSEKKDGSSEFTLSKICSLLIENDFHHPNSSRLKKNLDKSKKVAKGIKKGCYRLHIQTKKALEKELIVDDFETVEHINSVIPNNLMGTTRNYIKSLAVQINASYEKNIYDGCAVLMRRLLEILLIHSYENLSIESEIKFNDSYKMLSEIIKNAKNNTVLGLSRNTKDCLDDFRDLGNFSAHKIYYTAKRNDVERVILNYRATIEELLYKSGFK